jgi:hypothetical protein
MKSLSTNTICIRHHDRSGSHICKAQGRKEKGRQVVALDHTEEFMKELINRMIVRCDGELCDNIGFGIIALFAISVMYISLSQI